jgi:formamidopyrimidine-DNA glycosylase
MPELPEVQTIVDILNHQEVPGNPISRASVYWAKTIAGRSPEDFCEKITGCTIRPIRRRGKYIVLPLSGGLTLLVHLRMTGRLNWVPADSARNRHEHVVLDVGPMHSLRFQDTRKFGRMVLTRSPETLLNRLGPEPLDRRFTAGWFAGTLQTRQRQIKPLLLDQGFLAGLGNIYVDEALWEAGIHPQRISRSLTRREVGALHRAIPHVLQKGLRNLGTSLGSGRANFYFPGNGTGRNAEELNVFRRTGAACPRCGSVIVRIRVAQRSSHICPRCQKRHV